MLAGETAAGALLPLQFEAGPQRDVALAFGGAYAGDLGLWALVIAAAGAMMITAVWWMAEPSNAAARLGQNPREALVIII